jgi:hypothetical protein
MICPRCNTTNSSESTSCIKCGHSLADEGTATTWDSVLGRANQIEMNTFDVNESKQVFQGSRPSTFPEGWEIERRYLFARSLLGLRQGKTEEVRNTASAILQNAQSYGVADTRAGKALAYLKGMALLGEGRPEDAVVELSRACFTGRPGIYDLSAWTGACLSGGETVA